MNGFVLFKLMLMRKGVFFRISMIAFVLLLFCAGCIKPKDVLPGRDGDVCTQEFRMISVTVTGVALDDYFTLRPATSDTIRIEQWHIYDNQYPVLDDNYLQWIKNDTDYFYFVGIVNDSVVVNERFEMGADACHVYLVEGETEINL